MFKKSTLTGSIALLSAVVALAAAENAQTKPGSRGAPVRPKSTAGKSTFYREARSYGTKRDTDPPRYVRRLSDTGTERLKQYDWLDVGLDFRYRYEYRDDDARRPRPGLDDLHLLRTRAFLKVREKLDPFRFAVEFEDSRRYGSEYPRDDRDVNEFEFIQAYAELHFPDALGSDPLGNERPLSIRAGRMAFEFLDRRLIANNQWRNTTNTFQGFRLTLGQDANDWQLDLLALQPLERLKYEFDEPKDGQWFYAAIGHWRGWSDIITLEPYFLSLQQDTLAGLPGRSIHSLALRGYGLFGDTGFDYDFDAVYQFGRNGPEQHRAFGFTGEIGYTFAHAWQPRVSAFYGYASGDRDPGDQKDQRFERYFGFGRPWSANDYIDWSNISTPKVRLEIQPGKNLRVDAGYSFYWLASDTDRWSNANLRDKKGNSGNFIGHEFDIRARYAISSKVEAIAGYAHFTPGEFTRKTGKPDDTDFAYLEISVSAF
ncbi:MAG: alginate export family protein [Chthoniobacteraceae bacterium]